MATVGCATPNDNGGYEWEDQEQGLESLYFIRHRFMEENATVGNLTTTDELIDWSYQHYKPAAAYMEQKVIDLKTQLTNETARDNFLKPVFDERFVNDAGGFNTGIIYKVDETLSFNNIAYSFLMGAIGAKYVIAVDGSYPEYNNFTSYYNVLSLRNYNDSLGVLRNDTNLPFNRESETLYNTVKAIDGNDNIGANGSQEFYNNVETKLHEILQTVANYTGVSMQTLVDTVNLSLLNDSLWGARDLGVTQAGFQLSNSNTRLEKPNNDIDKLTSTTHRSPMSAAYGRYVNEYEQAQAQTQDYGRTQLS